MAGGKENKMAYELYSDRIEQVWDEPNSTSRPVKLCLVTWEDRNSDVSWEDDPCSRIVCWARDLYDANMMASLFDGTYKMFRGHLRKI